MSSEAEAILTGVAAHIGNYADAVRVPAAAELIYGAALVDIISVRQWLN